MITLLVRLVKRFHFMVRELRAEEKKRGIEQKITALKDAPLGEIKSALGDDYSYGEIKLVYAHQNYLNKG